MAAQRPLEPLILVRVQAPQLVCLWNMKPEIEEDSPENINGKITIKRVRAVFGHPARLFISRTKKKTGLLPGIYGYQDQRDTVWGLML